MTHNDLMTGILSPHRSSRPTLMAAVAAAVIVTGTVSIAPFGHLAGPVLPPVVLMYAVSMSLIQALTAYFLAIQCRSIKEPFLGALAGAFGFVAVLICAQMLVLQNVFAAQELFSGGLQTSVWMWASWHAGFPLFILLALILRAGVLVKDEAVRLRIGLSLIFLGPALGALTAYICIADGSHLPMLIVGNGYEKLRHSAIFFVTVLGEVATLLALLRVTRLRDLLSLWLAIALLASLSDVVLTVSGSTTFDLGWYAGRSQSVISASVIFCVLIYELSQVYGRLVTTSQILAQRAVRDGLTGAFNRGYFAEQFPREVRRAAREQASLALIMLDVDHFKAYNDLCGHQRGDECLTAIVSSAQMLLRRPGDFIARYGGEEFAILLPRTDRDGAMRMALELRDALTVLNLRRSDTATGRVTISIGIATTNPLIGCEPEDLLSRADQALYQAKREGRDTIRLRVEPSIEIALPERDLQLQAAASD